MAKPVPLKDVIERQKVAPPGQVDETYAVAMLVRIVLMVLCDKGKEKILEKQRYRRGKMRVPTDDTDETDVIFKRGRGDFFRRGLHGRDGIRNKEPGGICGICGIRGPRNIRCHLEEQTQKQFFILLTFHYICARYQFFNHYYPQ